MSEEAQTEEIPNSTRDLEIDDEKELMIEDLDLWYGDKQALYGVSLPCLLYTSPSPRDRSLSRMPSSA